MLNRRAERVIRVQLMVVTAGAVTALLSRHVRPIYLARIAKPVVTTLGKTTFFFHIAAVIGTVIATVAGTALFTFVITTLAIAAGVVTANLARVAIFARAVYAAFVTIILSVTTATVAAFPVFYRLGTRMSRFLVTALRSCCIIAITRILATARLAAGATPLTLLCLIIPVITRVTWRMGAGGRNC